MRPILPLAALLCAGLANPAHAAASYDSCTGTIASLPATLTTQGTWCLKSDLSTALASGNSITVATNNVTIDCNGFKIGNLQAGLETLTTGIYATERIGVTVRGCNVRGFRTGMNLSGLSHVVEDNRVEASRHMGIRVSGAYHTVRRNQVVDTGGQSATPIGIYFVGDTDVRDNVVNGVFPALDLGTPTVSGIRSGAQADYTVRGNTLRGLTTLGAAGTLFGIAVLEGEGDVVDNKISAVPGTTDSVAIACLGLDGFVRDNRANGFTVLTEHCPAEGSGNELH